MTGSSISYSSLHPVGNESSNEPDNDEHGGDVTLSSAILYGMYGFSDKVNLKVSAPYKRWHQYNVEHEDSHHRNETVSGFGDIRLGIRTILSNKIVGPGQRFFVDADIFLPTAPDYAINPFGNDADQVPHEHFALGTGQYSAALGLEYWLRSEFPWIIGVSSQLKEPLNTSTVGYRPGRKIRTELHLIRQKPVITSVFPYIKLSLRWDLPDRWEGENAPNSGGTFLDAFGQLNFEVSENSSLILSLGTPLWQSVTGSQLNGINGSVSFRVTR